jgi:hypothetical protein
MVRFDVTVSCTPCLVSWRISHLQQHIVLTDTQANIGAVHVSCSAPCLIVVLLGRHPGTSWPSSCLSLAGHHGDIVHPIRCTKRESLG